MTETRRYHQKLPAIGPEREAIREKGQFWTPDWVAEAMVGYVVSGGSPSVFDPAVGAGAFFRAAKTIADTMGRNFGLLGTEIDPHVLQQLEENGLSSDDIACVKITDFVLDPPSGPFKAIVANPPYIRHHRLTSGVKAQLRAYGATLIGKALDGRAGLHIYFLLRALQLLDTDGRLAFIMPADTCEGVFSSSLWDWITCNYRLEAVITFTAKASPFPNVDTNPIIFMIRNAKPKNDFLWVRCTKAETEQLREWTLSGLAHAPGDALVVCQRALAEGLATGLSRSPVGKQSGSPILGDFAKVMRGIATGANNFFFLTVRQATELGIPNEFLIPAIGRTRDVPGDRIDFETIGALEAAGRPTLLFSPDGRPIDSFPKAVREYLKHGETLELHRKPLIATRRPWYKMEVRPAPPILFAYLGRRHARFIRNVAGVVPLTGLLCVYPHREDREFIDKLWETLQHPEAISNLWLVGKSYGDGAIKVEPRALETLRIPESVVTELSLYPVPKPKQLQLSF